MRTISVFCAQCICGFRFETPEREFTCPDCKRLIALEWGVTDDDTQPEHAGEKVEAEVAT
jgi:hypothetical protein